MKIAVMQASSQSARNSVLYDLTCRSAKEHTVINFGCFEDENETYSYIEMAVEIGLLLGSGAVDFAVTGCSSGQGMMLACNSFPDVLCGYIENPQDAYLFGRINGGNAVSLPLGLNYGWAGEINMQHTLEALFDGPFAEGYPPESAQRKRADMEMLKKIRRLSQIGLIELLNSIDQGVVDKALRRGNVTDYILNYGVVESVIDWLRKRICGC